jgi:hypothetical protein
MRRLHSDNSREGPALSALRSLTRFFGARGLVGLALVGGVCGAVLLGAAQTFAEDERLLEIIDPMIQPVDAVTQERTEYTEIEVVEDLVERQTVEAAPLPEQKTGDRSARRRSSPAATPASSAERSTVESIDFTPMDLQALAGVGIAGGLDAPDLDTDSNAPIFESPITEEQKNQLRKYDTREDLGRFNIPSEFRLRPEPVSISGRTYNYDYIISTPR